MGERGLPPRAVLLVRAEVALQHSVPIKGVESLQNNVRTFTV